VDGAARAAGVGNDEGAGWSPPLRDLVSAVAAVKAQVPVELPGPQAVAEAKVLVQQLEVLRSVVLTRIADVDVRTLHTLAEAPSTSSWLDAQQTSLTRGEVAFARRLAAFPVLAAAVDAGAPVGCRRRTRRSCAGQGPPAPRPPGRARRRPAW
jgi:hypothetical protein